METNNANRAPGETRPPSANSYGTESSGLAQPARPTLNRADSRTAFPQQLLRPGVPPQAQPRPQFQPGGQVTSPPQLAPRPGTPLQRGPVPSGQSVPQQPRPQQPPLRPSGPHSIAPQQGPRPLQPVNTPQPLQRGPPPNNLQFGPRQPPIFGTATTPDAARPQIPQQFNGAPRNGSPASGAVSLSRQTTESSAKGLNYTNPQNKPVNLDNQSASNEFQAINKTENGIEIPGVNKGRSYSIAAAPGSPNPFKLDEDRRKSVSSIGGKMEEFCSRSPGLGLIQEGKIDSRDNIRSSKESIRSEASNDGGKDIPDRPESRLSGSKMTESFIGSLSNSNIKKKNDDDEDVVLQNNLTSIKNGKEAANNQQKNEFLDRSPSLTRSDDSPEPKQFVSNSPAPINKSQSVTPDPQRPKTPKLDIKLDSNKDVKSPVTPSKITSKSPVLESHSFNKKQIDLNMPITPTDSKKSTPRRVASAPKTRPKEGDNDSGVDESTQGNDLNGSPGSPNKSKVPTKLPTKEKSSNSLKPSLSRSSSKSATAKTPENPLPTEKKKVPMNKVQVGNAPSPNIKTVKSKIGSLDNATYRPGGGKIKIENRKLEFGNVTPKIAAKNDAYTPSGGSKKIVTTKLEWNAKSKIGSLQNAAYKPGGGDKKIETVKLDFKDKAKPKVASTVNITHKPGGGAVKSTVTKNGTRAIENQKLEFKAQSKVGSLDNVKHKPGGGDIKIFDDKEYIKQMGGQSPVPEGYNRSQQESPLPPTAQQPKSDENLNQQQC
ncbi:microtubule-associated protein 2 [Achroia grisella]|uniref:microtubule-associated protein 2 n=1 Tax=Achroia grisella TaxID=688607 RepID=UPI0027D2811C|nr:microtubule-associated protein 2 [Achroia grisella]